ATPRLLADYMDGRVTWQRRDEVDRHLNECWRCVDLFCRVREADFLMHRRRPLDTEEVDRFLRVLGIEQPRTTFWQKVLSVGWN
ncbi:MAG: zf-HC2 domain-containing protein, partial [Acidobacteria bacterium]|nr:zf-HC2 domain-containing protein [Acidobacteriota bacterium]